MAALEAAVYAKQAVASKARKRLIADPLVSSNDLKDIIMLHCAFKGNKKLYDLISPDVAGPRLLGWQTRPHGWYMFKMAGICYDIVKVAPNTKIMSTKLVAAIRSLIGTHVINSTKKTDDDFAETCDQMIRIALSMYRTLKRDREARDVVNRSIPKEQLARLNIVLDAITLPVDYLDVEKDEEEENQSPVPVYNASRHGLASETASTPASLPLSPSMPAAMPASWGETPKKDWGFGWESKASPNSVKPDHRSGIEALGFPTEMLPTERIEEVNKTVKSGVEELGFPTRFLETPRESQAHVKVGSSSQAPVKVESQALVPMGDDLPDDDERLLEEALAYKAEESKTPKKRVKKAKKDKSKPKSAEKTVKLPKDDGKFAGFDKWKVSSIDLSEWLT